MGHYKTFFIIKYSVVKIAGIFDINIRRLFTKKIKN